MRICPIASKIAICEFAQFPVSPCRDPLRMLRGPVLQVRCVGPAALLGQAGGLKSGPGFLDQVAEINVVGPAEDRGIAGSGFALLLSAHTPSWWIFWVEAVAVAIAECPAIELRPRVRDMPAQRPVQFGQPGFCRRQVPGRGMLPGVFDAPLHQTGGTVGPGTEGAGEVGFLVTASATSSATGIDRAAAPPGRNGLTGTAPLPGSTAEAGCGVRPMPTSNR